MKYTIIKTEEQYNEYCSCLEKLVSEDKRSSTVEDEIELLSLLIEKWDDEHNTMYDLDPIRLLKVLMKENNLKSKDIVEVLGVSKSLVSSILNYRRGLSKENIRLLSAYFSVSQDAFNRPYKLISDVNKKYKNASLMNSKKDLEPA
jgi:HTH-type transcriptional regulator/antitoxin HigA